MDKTLVNLHAHSYYSDGYDSPRELAGKAKNAGIKAVALTDHDAYQGQSEFLDEASRLGIDTITGIEISSNYKDTDVHILGYGYDLTRESELNTGLAPLWKMHDRRAQLILDKYAQAGIMDVTIEDVMRENVRRGPYITKRHIQAYRMEKYGLSFGQVEKETARGGVARVAYPREHIITPEAAVKLIRQVGGVAVLAHPGEFWKRTDGDPGQALLILNEVLDKLQAVGLFGLEVHYSEHTPEQNRFFAKMARGRGLFITAGSDYHGLYNLKRPLTIDGMTYKDFIAIRDMTGK